MLPATLGGIRPGESVDGASIGAIDPQDFLERGPGTVEGAGAERELGVPQQPVPGRLELREVRPPVLLVGRILRRSLAQLRETGFRVAVGDARLAFAKGLRRGTAGEQRRQADEHAGAGEAAGKAGRSIATHGRLAAGTGNSNERWFETRVSVTRPGVMPATWYSDSSKEPGRAISVPIGVAMKTAVVRPSS